jgi:hypothetical protein
MLHLVPLAGAGRKVADMDQQVELVSDALQLMLGGFELFRVGESQAADREIDDFMAVPRSRPG